MDSKLRKLSHSSRLSLHECPRKFQLYRLAAERDPGTEDEKGTFGFGHLVGTGIQNLFEGKDLQQVIWEAFLAWKSDLFFLDEKRKKSFWYGVIALKKINVLFNAGFLKDYELVQTHDGKPAIELGFRIFLPNGFQYRGFVDVVLRHKVTGVVLVLEIKTSSWQVVANAFKNSGQAIGYSVVLDHLFENLSSYKVLYLVYKTKEQEYEPVEYQKTLYQRALWLNELLLECQVIELYQNADVWPMHGENCINKFGKECKYFGICTMKTESIIRGNKSDVDEKHYHYDIQFDDLVRTQLKSVTIEEVVVNAPEHTGHVDTETDEVL